MRHVVAAGFLDAGEGVIIENGLARAAVPHYDRADRIVAHATEDIKKGDLCILNPGTGQLRKAKPR